MKRLAISGALLALFAATAAAQQARGTITDSASRRPLPGTVLLLLDASGNVIGRNLTNERGEYLVALTPAMRRLRVQRIGFRPREAPIAPTPNGVIEIDIAMPAIPTFLEPVRVTANACGRRSDQGSALALLEQARAGLLATVVARETKPAALVLYMFERTMDGTSDKIERQTVRVDSANRAAVSFSAVHDAKAFVRRGFMEDGIGGQTFFAPDADVLLDDGFAAGYCFRLMNPDRARPNQVGLGFAAADRRRDRVDIDGALWIDTVARALRDIEFRYVGLDSRIQRFEPGGFVGFREMTNGVVLVDRWSLRLVGARHDTVPARSRDNPRINLTPYAHESGGELARAVWKDGTTWRATLGSVAVRAQRRNGTSASDIRAWLIDTPYRATADSAGQLTMSDLIPGPYSLVVADSALQPLKLAIPTDLWFMSKRDSSHFTVKVPTLDEFVVDRCLADRRFRYSLSDTTRILARVTRSDGTPVADAPWRVRINLVPDDVSRPWTVVRDGGRTSANGVFQVCDAQLQRGATVEIAVWVEGAVGAVDRRRLTERVNIFPIVLDPRR